jgi:S-disulfanyl-L-cysteine oxidoreductase SoxD
MLKKLAVICVVGWTFCAPATAQTPAPAKTTLDGVFSETQTARGKATYTTFCASCHGDDLKGVSAPELTGNRFIGRWREGTLDGIYEFMRQVMPKGGGANAKRMSDTEYLDVLAYMLKANDYPAGPADLGPAVLSNVLFVGKNGPQPVPDGALVITVGCLSQNNNGTWVLQSATEPARTRFEMSTPAELKSSMQKNLGTLEFRLADLEAVPDFMPAAHKGHKIEAKGYLVRQPNAERISLSSLAMLDSNCASK